MTRSEISTIPDYFRRYVELIPEEYELLQAMREYGIPSLESEISRLEELGDEVYAPGKWTIRQILIHLNDTERIFAYRALRFARGDTQSLVGMDQDVFVDGANLENRSVQDLFEEFKSIRNSSLSLFGSFDEQHWHREGVASGMPVSVGALGYMICGHVEHHLLIIKDRYFPLLRL